MSASIAFQQAVDEETRKIKHEMKRRGVLASNALRSEALQVLSGARGGESYRVPSTKKYYAASASGSRPRRAPAPFATVSAPNWNNLGIRIFPALKAL